MRLLVSWPRLPFSVSPAPTARYENLFSHPVSFPRRPLYGESDSRTLSRNAGTRPADEQSCADAGSRARRHLVRLRFGSESGDGRVCGEVRRGRERRSANTFKFLSSFPAAKVLQASALGDAGDRYAIDAKPKSWPPRASPASPNGKSFSLNANPRNANPVRPSPTTRSAASRSRFQYPLSVKGSIERTQVAPDLRLELFAAEPDIAKPIFMAWDERGRLWIAETRDYPHDVKPDGMGNDSIKICEDTNGDGKADKFTVFADKLNIPTGLAFANGGIVVAQPPRFLFLKDTNGDDKADVRQEIMTGWGVKRHACAGEQSSLRLRQLALRLRRLLRLPRHRRRHGTCSSRRAPIVSRPMAPRSSSCTSSRTTPGARASTNPATSSAARPTTRRSSSAAFPRRLSRKACGQ